MKRMTEAIHRSRTRWALRVGIFLLLLREERLEESTPVCVSGENERCWSSRECVERGKDHDIENPK